MKDLSKIKKKLGKQTFASAPVFSKAFTSTLSNFESSLTQTLSLTKNSGGKRNAHKMYSTVSDLQLISHNDVDITTYKLTITIFFT